MKLSLAVVAGAALASVPGTDAAPCSALVIGGLGSQQAYVAGALNTLATKANVEYDIVVSTSASVVAAQAAASGTTKQWAANALKAVKGLSASDMYAEFPGGEASGLTDYGGLYNDTAAATIYSGILGTPTGTNTRQVSAIAVSLTTTLQTPLPVTTTDVASSVAGLMASAADPATYAAFPASFNGANDLFVSGEVRGQVNVFEAINQCRATGAADSEITVDVIYTTASNLKNKDVKKDKTLAVLLRKDAIDTYINAQQDVLYAKFAYPSINFRYEVSPSFALLTDTTNYNGILRLGMISRGNSDAAAEIKRINSKQDCDPSADAPSTCTMDQDCVTWAAKYCFSRDLAMSGRCLSSPANKGKCSFNATEIEDFRSEQATRTDNAICQAVAFSGGGDRGAYEAGVMKGLASNAAASTIAYDVVSGVSVGSIVGSSLAKFPIGEETDAADYMVSTALGITREIIYKNWTNLVPFIGPKGIVRGLLFESGLFDSSGERTFLTQQFPAHPLDPSKSYRELTALATNMGTGEGEVFSFEGAAAGTSLVDALMASSAIQGTFPMVEIDGEYYGDGGAVATIDVYSAVQACRNKGFADANIQVDTISVAGFSQVVLPAGLVFALNSTQIQSRVDIIKQIDDLMAVIDFYRTSRPDLFRRNIFPSTLLPGTGIEFNQEQMQQMVTIGETDGEAAANNPCNGAANANGTVACGSDKDCFNFNVEKCQSNMKKTTCDYKKRVCVFAE